MALNFLCFVSFRFAPELLGLPRKNPGPKHQKSISSHPSTTASHAFLLKKRKFHDQREGISYPNESGWPTFNSSLWNVLSTSNQRSRMDGLLEKIRSYPGSFGKIASTIVQFVLKHMTSNLCYSEYWLHPCRCGSVMLDCGYGGIYYLPCNCMRYVIIYLILPRFLFLALSLLDFSFIGTLNVRNK